MDGRLRATSGHEGKRYGLKGGYWVAKYGLNPIINSNVTKKVKNSVSMTIENWAFPHWLH